VILVNYNLTNPTMTKQIKKYRCIRACYACPDTPSIRKLYEIGDIIQPGILCNEKYDDSEYWEEIKDQPKSSCCGAEIKTGLIGMFDHPYEECTQCHRSWGFKTHPEPGSTWEEIEKEFNKEAYNFEDGRCDGYTEEVIDFFKRHFLALEAKIRDMNTKILHFHDVCEDYDKDILDLNKEIERLKWELKCNEEKWNVLLDHYKKT
jgi:hypothetical protein